ncbi:MAG: ABC transporter ATP-binding protein [Thermoplasmata archaeon]
MTTPLVSVSNLTYLYEDGTLALENISFEISKGERVGLIGENGSGKTTLCKHLNGILKPSQGRVLIEGKDIAKMNIAEIVGKVGLLFQNPDNQLFCSTVTEEMSFGLRNLGLNEDEIAARSQRYARLLGIDGLADRSPLMLSLGLRRLVTIASVLAMEQDLVLLDEPTAWLDRFQSRTATDAIKGFASSGRTIVVVSHNMKLIADLTERAIVLSHGRKIADGSTREILSNKELLLNAGLFPTPISELASDLSIAGQEHIITEDDLIRALCDGREGDAVRR